ncbi:hypothetical protein TGAM01_v205024, partial [Trichoderma gamsii]
WTWGLSHSGWLGKGSSLSSFCAHDLTAGSVKYADGDYGSGGKGNSRIVH